MNRVNEHLLSYLGSHGACSASELSGAMKISQPTLSRAITSLGQQRIVRIGQARSTRYARRSERPGNECPLYLIDESGQAFHLGVLYELSRGEWLFQQDSPWKSLRGDSFRDGLYPGLPWFLQDMRPCGFLGRCFAHSHAQALQASRNPADWSDALVLAALRRFGQDMLGALIVGEEMLEQVRSLTDHRREALSEKEIPQAYPQMAEQALAGEWPGSLAAGEQPKFTATVMGSGGEIRHALVKFSGDMKLPESRRWSDLLRAENVANRVLSEAGWRCARSRIICSAGRTFLEAERFDRCGATGRRAVVSLEALDAAYVGVNGLPWNRAAVALRDAGWISAADAEHLTLFWWFGMLTGNTDMHYGNIAFYLDPNPPLRLAPLYDMVPMFYRPGLEGKLPSDVLKLAPPPPEEFSLWRVAADLARNYWQEIAHDQDVSSDFRDIAAKNRAAVSAVIERWASLRPRDLDKDLGDMASYQKIKERR